MHGLWDLAKAHIHVIYIYIVYIYTHRYTIVLQIPEASIFTLLAVRGTLRNCRLAIGASNQPAPKCIRILTTSRQGLPLKPFGTWPWRRDASGRPRPGMMGRVDIFKTELIHLFECPEYSSNTYMYTCSNIFIYVVNLYMWEPGILTNYNICFRDEAQAFGVANATLTSSLWTKML